MKLKIFFVSKLSLFMHFKESNGQQKIECITDRVIKKKKYFLDYHIL